MNGEWARIGWRYDQPVSSQVSGSSREGGSAELIVVGGGLIGLSCAWRAAEAGLDVLVIDAGGTERASVVAAGMIAPVGEASWGEDDLLAAALLSADRWPEFARDLEAAARNRGAVSPLRCRAHRPRPRRGRGAAARARAPRGARSLLRVADGRRLPAARSRACDRCGRRVCGPRGGGGRSPGGAGRARPRRSGGRGPGRHGQGRARRRGRRGELCHGRGRDLGRRRRDPRRAGAAGGRSADRRARPGRIHDPGAADEGGDRAD